jgi:methylisocitrate lyase
MSLRARLEDALPVTAPLVLNPLMARMVEAAGFPAGYLGGGATGYQKVALEANLNLTEMCQAALDIRAVSSLPLILDGACGYGDPMHMHRTIGMAEAAGFAAIEIEDQLVPKRAHHHVGLEHMIAPELMAAKIREAVAARRSPELLVIGRTNAVRASTMDDALRRGELYRKAGADVVLLSMAHSAEQLARLQDRRGPVDAALGRLRRLEAGLCRARAGLRLPRAQERLGGGGARGARRDRHRAAPGGRAGDRRERQGVRWPSRSES